MGVELQSDFNFNFERSVTTETIATRLGNEPPDIPTRLAAACGTDTASYLSEGPGLSVFIRSAGAVYLTYSTSARGLEPVMVYYGILDRVPTRPSRGATRGSNMDRDATTEFAVAT